MRATKIGVFFSEPSETRADLYILMSLGSFDEYVWTLCDQENAGLEQELQVVKLQLTEAQNSVSRLQNNLDQLLNDKVSL